MAPKFNRVIRDKRRLSRLSALMACEFQFREETHRAIVIDMSLNSVLLSSRVLPPNESTVTIFLHPPEPSSFLVLSGTVVRGAADASETEEPGAFVVRFDDIPPGLLKILHTLISEQKGNIPTVS